MKTRIVYRDGLEEAVVGPIRTHYTSDGHTIESYRLEGGKKRFFVTLKDTHWCAHGDTIAGAVADALWKDPERRPSAEDLKQQILVYGKKRKITLNEFRVLTGACLVGCREELKRVGRDESPLTAFEVRDLVSREWGNKLLSILGWGHDRS